MAFKKFGDNEKVIPLDKSETNVIQSFKEKIGKSVEEFTDEEREELHKALKNEK